LLYTLSSAVAVALLCGALPGIRAARHGFAGALSEAGRRQVSTRNPLQWLLVGAQVALSVTLLAGAGLLVRSFWELSRVNPGFEASRVLTFRMTGSWAETMDLQRLAQRLETTREALRALPGIEAAATTISLPGVRIEHEAEFALAEGPSSAGLRIISEVRSVSPSYFDAMRIPLLDGEECRAQVPRTPRDVVVNQSFATRYLAGRSSAVGLYLREVDDSSTHRIVGVVGDTRERSLERTPGPTVIGAPIGARCPIFWCGRGANRCRLRRRCVSR
jgi:putative ABC transport system permease protein